MATVLHMDASVRGERSLSRMLSRHFIEAWLARRPADTIVYRDLGRDPPPHVSEPWIAAVFTPPDQLTPAQKTLIALSDRYIGELEAADVVVLGTPMYNYGMPSVLKAWVDQVVRIDKTFSFDLARGDFPLQPILTGKTLVMLTAKGEFGFMPGGVRAHMNHLEPHILTVAHYLGIAEHHHIGIEYQEFGGERHSDSIATAKAKASALASGLCESRASRA